MRKYALLILAALPAFSLSFDFFTNIINGKESKQNQITGESQYYENADMYDTENVAGRINNLCRLLSDQLFANKNFYKINDPVVAITSLVYQTNFDATNKLGSIIAENFIHEFQVRGYRVIDYKIMPIIKVRSDGDVVMSRNIDELKSKHLINYVVTGTITDMYNGVVLNVRIVDLSTNIVLSTAQAFLDKKTYYMMLRKLKSSEDDKEIDEPNTKEKAGAISVEQPPAPTPTTPTN